jgi:hypothetical protein
MLRLLDPMAVLDIVTEPRLTDRQLCCAARSTKLYRQLVKTDLSAFNVGLVAGHLLYLNVHSGQLTLFVLSTVTHCVGGMQVVRIVTAVLHTF